MTETEKETGTAVTETQQTPSAPPYQAEKASWTPAIAITALLLSAFSVYRTEFSSSSADGIVVLDSIRLTRSYQAKAENERIHGSKTAEQIDREAYATEQAINKKVDELGKAGKVVVQKQSVWAYPEAADITAEIAASLDIKLVAADSANPTPLPPRSGNQPVPDSLPQNGTGMGPELD